MAFRSRLVTVGTSATAVSSTTGDGDGVSGSAGTVMNVGSARVFLGGADVTTSGAASGLWLDPGDAYSWEASGADVLYGRVASGTCDVGVNEVGVPAG